MRSPGRKRGVGIPRCNSVLKLWFRLLRREGAVNFFSSLAVAAKKWVSRQGTGVFIVPSSGRDLLAPPPTTTEKGCAPGWRRNFGPTVAASRAPVIPGAG